MAFIGACRSGLYHTRASRRVSVRTRKSTVIRRPQTVRTPVRNLFGFFDAKSPDEKVKLLTDDPGVKMLKEGALQEVKNDPERLQRHLDQLRRYEKHGVFTDEEKLVWIKKQQALLDHYRSGKISSYFHWLTGVATPKKGLQLVAHELYLKSKIQSEHRAFKALGLPNNFQNWFNMLALHLWILNTRMRKVKDVGGTVEQQLVDIVFEDIETAVGIFGRTNNPISISRSTKRLHKNYNGALVAYDEGLRGSDPQLADALWRNIFSMHPELVSAQKLATLVEYIRRNVRDLDQVPDEEFLKAKMAWTNYALVEPIIAKKVRPPLKLTVHEETDEEPSLLVTLQALAGLSKKQEKTETDQPQKPAKKHAREPTSKRIDRQQTSVEKPKENRTK